jgi:hypothetical protein
MPTTVNQRRGHRVDLGRQRITLRPATPATGQVYFGLESVLRHERLPNVQTFSSRELLEDPDHHRCGNRVQFEPARLLAGGRFGRIGCGPASANTYP